MLDGGPSDSIDLPGGWRAAREYNLLRLLDARARKAISADFSVPIALDGITIVAAAGFKFEASTIPAADATMPDTLSVAMFDAAKIADAGLVARSFRKGDRIHPVGMHGTRKVHDVFVDRKLPRASRERFPVVTLGDAIAWLPGLARATVRSSPTPPKPYCALRRLQSPLSAYHVACALTCVILF